MQPLFLELRALSRGSMWAVKGIRRKFTGHHSDIRRTPSTALNPGDPIPSPSCLCVSRPPDSCPRLYPSPIMSEDHASKQRRTSRSAITNTAPAKQLVHPRPGSSSRETPDDTRPAKRTRKAINCEPCRNSKLKCDRFVRVRRCGCFFFKCSSTGTGPVLLVFSAVRHIVLLDLRQRLTSPRTDSSKFCRDGRSMLPRGRWSTSPP